MALVIHRRRLGDFLGADTFGAALNDAGEVVGISGSGLETTALLFRRDLVVPHPVDAEPGLCAAIRDAGVRVTPGRGFFAAPPRRAHLRLSIACFGEDRIEEGCRRLGAALAGR